MNKDKRAAFYLFLALGGISLILLSTPMTGKVRGLRALVSYLLDPIPFYGGAAINRLGDVPADVLRLIDLDIENRRLQEQLKDTDAVRVELEALRRENERLAAEAGITPQVPRGRRWARILERDPMNWHSSVMIDAGGAQGVEV